MGESDQSFEVVEQVSGRRWSLTLYPEHVRLVATEGAGCHEVDRADAAQQLLLQRPVWGVPLLTLTGPKKIHFRLQPSQALAIEAWLGPLTRSDLELALKQRLSWGLVIGLVLVIASLPRPADPDTGAPGAPFNAWLAALGLTLIVLRTLMRYAPHRRLFLLDSAWFVAFGSDIAYGVWRGDHWLWLAVTFFSLTAALGGIEQYRRFSRTAPYEVSRTDAPEPDHVVRSGREN